MFPKMACKVVPVFSGLFLVGESYFPQELTALEGVTSPPSSGSPEWGPALGYVPLLLCHSLEDTELYMGKSFRPLRKSLSLCVRV